MRLCALAVLWALTAVAQEVPVSGRMSTAAELEPKFERYELPNGLIVILSADERMNAVVVDLSFEAGVVRQTAKQTGLAHLTEHVVATGGRGDGDYRALLERRGGTQFGASTTIDRMSFRVMVPPEEVPLALWVNADRLAGATLPELTADELRRHQRIVAQERVHRIDDAPYGASAVAVKRSLFPPGHPLQGGMSGTRKVIEALTVDDVVGFARRWLVPANGVLVVVGRFDPVRIKEVIANTVGLVPGGVKPAPISSAPPTAEARISVTEELGRRPRVTLGWSLPDPLEETAEALSFGSLLLTIYTDGFVGMNVSANYTAYTGGGLFMLDVTMPHVLDKLEATGNAEVVFRYLARATMPKDIVAATLLAWDRDLMTRLHSANSLATLLLNAEARHSEPLFKLSRWERHWAITPERVQAVTEAALKGPRVQIMSRPTRPLPRKLTP